MNRVLLGPTPGRVTKLAQTCVVACTDYRMHQRQQGRKVFHQVFWRVQEGHHVERWLKGLREG